MKQKIQLILNVLITLISIILYARFGKDSVVLIAIIISLQITLNIGFQFEKGGTAK